MMDAIELMIAVAGPIPVLLLLLACVVSGGYFLYQGPPPRNIHQ